MHELTTDALTNLYDKVSGGGFVIVDDFGAVEECKRVVMDWRGIEDRCKTLMGLVPFGAGQQHL
jgi:hypothetical protein